ncbi:MAG: CDP-alcohol phosphatidyltransferase family protein [Rhizobiales bacterium]|nr:CDP-alcohol phosphatidyltransferase family protein [Hyphomicrobiales bacterium]
MFDSRIRPLLDPPLAMVARRLASFGLSGDHLTFTGLALGLVAALSVVAGLFAAALVAILLARLCDGLDGPVARAAGTAGDRGGFIDITLDFVFYALLPLAFALHDPDRNALAAAILLSGFLVNGAAFLAYATIAARRGLTTTAQGTKSFYYLSGLTEGAETIAAFIVFCLLPSWFWLLGPLFGLACWVSGLARIVVVYRGMAPGPAPAEATGGIGAARPDDPG